MTKLGCLATYVLAFLMVVPASAQDRVFVIRHAEKAEGVDPPLTPQGRERAARWGALLSDAGIDVVIHTDAARSRETAGIVSEALGVAPVELPLNDTAGITDLIEFDHEDDTVLIVAHTETIPGLLVRLGTSVDVAIGEDDFASLFIVSPEPEEADLLRLRMP